MNEWLEVVDETGTVIGCARRAICHRTPALLHRVVHVIVMDVAGRFFLQKRSMRKDIQPGKWDMSVGGHVMPDERPEEAARRETDEELGFTPLSLAFLYSYVWRSEVESELVSTFLCQYEGLFTHNPAEIDECKWWMRAEIEPHLHTGLFTPNFIEEYRRYNGATGNRDGNTMPGVASVLEPRSPARRD